MPLPPAPGHRAAKLSAEAFLPKRNTAKQAAKPEDDLNTPALNGDASAAPAAAKPRRSAGKAEAAVAKKPRKTAAVQPALEVKASTPAATAPAKPPAESAAKQARRARNTRTGPTTLFVLDTNVLLHDPSSLFRFEEHDIFLPMVVLEELDNHKKGMTEVARNGRQVSRTLDSLVASQPADGLEKGLPLNATGQRTATGTLYFQT